MKSPLRILHLEDDPNDAELIKATLEAGEIACTTTCVQSRADFIAALKQGKVDLILSDCSLPAFDGLSGLKIAHEEYPDLPFILVSGTMGEETAIDALKSGATDYVLKTRLSRLVPAVRRAMHEVEERKERQLADNAAQNERHFSEISLNSLPGIFYMHDQAGHFLRWNRNFETVSGYTAEEIRGMKPLDFFGANERDSVAAKIAEVFQAGLADIEVLLRAKDGKRTAYYFKGQRIQLAGKACLISMGIDISERKQLESKFIEAQKMEVVGHLASGVAHDFNNMLSIIMGYNALVIAKLEPDNPIRKYSDEILQAAERAAGLTRQLLVFSSKQAIQSVVLDLNEVVLDLEKMLRRLIGEDLVMSFFPGQELGRIKADSGHIGQVLMNLIVNARDAIPGGGTITITTSNITLTEPDVAGRKGVLAGYYVRLSVADTGAGMTEEVKAHLFEIFFTTKPKGKGTGLGLATCETIVRQCGGYIEVHSALGEGTTFNIYFPRVEQPLAVTAKVIHAQPARGTETLLIVEDEPAVRLLARKVLEGQGYVVLSAANGQEALRLMREHTGPLISLVVTDVIMPLMGGEVMAEWLKATYPDIKILFTSGYTDTTLAQHTLLARDFVFLPKPYTPATLIRKVRAMLDNLNDTGLFYKPAETVG